jgi:hypothetical protein
LFIYEIFLPVADERGLSLPARILREACDELADRFGPHETRAVYHPLHVEELTVHEAELCRIRLDVPSTDENQRWLVAWRDTKEHVFGSAPWMIWYRQN